MAAPTSGAGDTVIDLASARPRATEVDPGDRRGGAHGLLHRIASTLNSTLDLPEVLHRLAAIALESTEGWRCSLFLLDGDSLQPGVSLGREADEELWSRFRAMGDVDLSVIPEGLRRLRALEAIAIPDAQSSRLVPEAWCEAFDLEALVLVPLHAGGEACGLLVVDYPRYSSFLVDDLELLESLAGYAGVGIDNARTYSKAARRAARQEVLARAALQLTAEDGGTPTTQVLAEAYRSLFEAPACVIGLLDEQHTRFTPIASTGGGESELPAPLPVAEIPAFVTDRLRGAWQERLTPQWFDPNPFLEQVTGTAAPRYVTFPLVVDERVRGVALVALTDTHRPDDETRDAARALASLSTAALERQALIEDLEQHVRRLEVLHAASTAFAEGADAPALVERLNGLLAGQGIEVLELSLRESELARRLRAADPVPAEERLEGPDAAPVELSGGVVAIPLLLGGTVVGALRIRPADLDGARRSFLVTVGAGIADVIVRGSLRTSIEAGDRERALAAERERIGAELHGTVGELFTAIGLHARRGVERLPRGSGFAPTMERLAALADSGKWEIDQAVRALSFVPGADRSLAAALSQLGASVARDSGMAVLVDTDEDLPRLPAGHERLLYRAAHEGLVNAWRHARCSMVRIGLRLDDEEIVLSVRDDGVGFGRHSGNRVAGIGITRLRRALDAVGGGLTVANGEPRGALVEARVPVGRR